MRIVREFMRILTVSGLHKHIHIFHLNINEKHHTNKGKIINNNLSHKYLFKNENWHLKGLV